MSDLAGTASVGDIVRNHWTEHVQTAQAFEGALAEVERVATVLCDAFAGRGVLYTFGNGGSAADAQHFTGEIIGHYSADRRPLPAVTLSTDPTTMTCIANDYSFDDVFSRQVQALARPGDVVTAFSTSGRSPNVVGGLRAARANGATTVLFGGGDGGPAAEFADHLLLSPSAHTPRIQEMHTLMLHAISDVVDRWAVALDQVAGGPTDTSAGSSAVAGASDTLAGSSDAVAGAPDTVAGASDAGAATRS